MTEETTLPKKFPWALIAAGVVAGALLAFLVLGLVRPHTFAGAELESPNLAPEMEGLVYDNGDPVSIEELRGDVVLVYFGYTNCPDLCPTTLATVARAKEDLGSRAEEVQTLMVTVDPTRDPMDLLGEYVRHFDPEFRGVWGTEEEVRHTATLYGVYFEYEEADEDGNYLVGHTSALFAVDRDGYARVVYPTGVAAGDLADDLKVLLS